MLSVGLVYGTQLYFIQAIDVALVALYREGHHALFMQMVEVAERSVHWLAEMHTLSIASFAKIWRIHNAVSLCLSFAHVFEDWLQFVAFDPQKLVGDFISAVLKKI